MPKPRANTIFCDDIRQEVDGKSTYVGVYSSKMDVVAEKYPVILPKLATAVRIIVPKDYIYKNMTYVIKMAYGDKEEVLSRKNFPYSRPDTELPTDGEVSIGILLHCIISPVILHGDATIFSRIYFDDVEIKAGALRVNITLDDAADSRSTAGAESD